jgi:transglutaminase-like putative cysteine protease
VKLDIRHNTHYSYSEPIRYAIQSLWLTPASGPTQTVMHWGLQAPAPLHTQQDGFGNTVATYTHVGEKLYKLVGAQGRVETHAVHQWAEGAHTPHPYVYLRATTLAEPHPLLAEFARQTPGINVPQPNLEAILALSRRVSSAVSYKKGSTEVNTTALEAFDWGTGVCQDQAHVFIACCRSIGIPARYVSGYFYAANEPDLASHAWADVCLDVHNRQWASIDITHACPTDERHVRLAVGTDYNACPPIKGIRQGGGQEQMRVEVTIEPVG